MLKKRQAGGLKFFTEKNMILGNFFTLTTLKRYTTSKLGKKGAKWG